MKKLLIFLSALSILCKPIYIPFYNQFNFEEYKKFMQNFIKPGDLVFDVGANVGKKTEIYLACGARVICIEPQPECVKELRQKFENNNNVRIEQKGLSYKEGSLKLFCSPENSISSFSESLYMFWVMTLDLSKNASLSPPLNPPAK